jgi:hypothetical protein
MGLLDEKCFLNFLSSTYRFHTSISLNKYKQYLTPVNKYAYIVYTVKKSCNITLLKGWGQRKTGFLKVEEATSPPPPLPISSPLICCAPESSRTENWALLGPKPRRRVDRGRAPQALMCDHIFIVWNLLGKMQKPSKIGTMFVRSEA